MRKKAFHTRTIKNGQVKLLGRVYAPDERWLKYDGRLEGLRYIFGLYHTGDQQLDFAHLWGSEAYDQGKEGIDEGADCVDGAFPWAWWHEVQSPLV